MHLLLGILLGALIGILAWRAHALSPDGAVAATLTGGLIFGLGGVAWAVLLLTFFVSSSVLSHTFSSRKVGLREKFSKGSQRDWGQVVANGGLGALLAVVHAMMPGQIWVGVAFAGAMAAVNADTWATELGVLSRVPPRLITNGKVVERGTSGGITILGMLATLGGAALIGGFAAALLAGRGASTLLGITILFGAILLAGLAGSLFDSLLGATAQAIFYCPTCRKETERHPNHLCGSKTVQIRGLRWLNNDGVNFACSLTGAGVAALIWVMAT